MDLTPEEKRLIRHFAGGHDRTSRRLGYHAATIVPGILFAAYGLVRHDQIAGGIGVAALVAVLAWQVSREVRSAAAFRALCAKAAFDASRPAPGRAAPRAADPAMPLAVEIEEWPAERDLRLIEQGLIDHAASCGVEARNRASLVVFLRDREGRVHGGLVGATVWGWLQIGQVWLADELRGKGYGAALMSAAEGEATRRGCHGALLDTFDFQARGFYERLGYEAFGELREFPRGHTRFFMQKALDTRPGKTRMGPTEDVDS